jgi:hypothetical protein
MASGGARKGAGRPKGSKSKRTQDVETMLQEMDCSPIESLARLAQLAEEDAQAAETPSERIPHMNLAKDCYKELAQYVAPKRKAIEHSGSIGMSHEDALNELK